MTEELRERSLRVVPVVERDPEDRMVSFATVLLGNPSHYTQSLSRILEIGDEISVPYEVVIGLQQNSDGPAGIAKSIKQKFPKVIIARLEHGNSGSCKKQVSARCSGKFLVFFDLDYIYDYSHADLMLKFINLMEKKMLFTELPIIPISLLNEAGGWRELEAGEDVDLYSRIAVLSGIIAYPRSELEDFECVSAPPPSVSTNILRRTIRNFTTIRDLMIGCNYGIGDMMLFNKDRGLFSRLALLVFFSACFVGTRFSTVRAVRFDRNNYLVFMESLAESLILKDHLRFDRPEDRITLGLSRNELAYLARKSKTWRQVRDSLDTYIHVDR
ncbi:MAG: glycosyltransferase family 2 protein [Thermoplasmataceae archaeon]